MTEILGQTSFIRFWLARVASVASLQMLMLAIGWHMYDLTGSALDLGFVGLFQFGPAMLTVLAAGHAADRFHRAKMVAVCLTVSTCVAGTLAWATSRGIANRELLFGLSIVLGGLRPFQMSAQQALIPMLVPRELMPRATAFASSGQQIAVIGGPALGGLLFAMGVNTVYLVCAALFAIAAMSMLTVRYAFSPSKREPATLATLFAGFRFIGSSPLLLGAISLDLCAVLLGGATALLPIFAADILHVGPRGLGLLRSAPAVGALVVGLLMARNAIETGVGRKLLVAVALYGVAIVGFGLSRTFGLSLAFLAVAGAADMISVIVRQTLVQLETPDAMRGRVASVNTLFVGASNQLGEFESGVTAAAFGPVASVVLGGVGTILVSLAWFRLFRPLATRDTFN